MLSIMNVGLTWDLFSIKYRQSPFYNLDSSVINNNVGDVPRVDSDDSDDEEVECEEMDFLNIIKNTRFETTHAAACRDVMQQMKSLTYCITDDAPLEELHGDLIKSFKKLELSAPKEDNLVLEKAAPAVSVASTTTGTFYNLPSLKRKSKFTGRVGVGVENKRLKADISVTGPRQQKTNVEEEISGFEDGTTYDVPLYPY